MNDYLSFQEMSLINAILLQLKIQGCDEIESDVDALSTIIKKVVNEVIGITKDKEYKEYEYALFSLFSKHHFDTVYHRFISAIRNSGYIEIVVTTRRNYETTTVEISPTVRRAKEDFNAIESDALKKLSTFIATSYIKNK